MGLGYGPLLGMSIVRWVGVASLLAMLAAAATGFMMLKGKAKMGHHKATAIAAILLAVAHTLLVLGVV